MRLWMCVVLLHSLLTLGDSTTHAHSRDSSSINFNTRNKKELCKSSGRQACRRSRKSYMAGWAEERLLGSLFRDYDTDARGVSDANETVVVSLEFLLLRIQGLDERSQVLTTTGLLITDWKDARLTWDPAQFSDLQDVVIKPERIWLPELALMNGADELAPDFKKIRVLLNHTGQVHWEPGGVFMTTCDIDIRYFPFDEQACPIKFGAWAYFSARMNLTNTSPVVETHEFKLNGEWEVFGSKAVWKETTLPCCPDTRYPYVEFTLFLRRRYTFYIMNIIVPCSLLSVLVMIVFCLPPDAGEKILLGISVLLAFTVFLLMVAENVPKTSLHVPIMVIYLTCTMGLGTVSVCLTVVVLNLHHRDPERPVPKWAKVLVLSYMSRILCVRARKPTTLANGLAMLGRSHGPMDLRGGLRRIAKDGDLFKPMLKPSEMQTDNRYSNSANVFQRFSESPPAQDLNNDWRELAHVMDRLFFWIVFIFMTASTGVILFVPMFRIQNIFT